MNRFRPYAVLVRCLIILSALVLLAATSGSAEEEPDCVACHGDLTAGKSVHQAISMGCTVCHSAIDASDIPHTITNKNPRGLASKMRDLCYGCHDKKPFMKITVHGAIRLGCTACHNPHASDHAHLLKEEIPLLCLNCHKERLVAKTNKSYNHAAGEICSNCHNPHSTDTPKLFVSGPRSAASDQTALVLKPADVQH